MEASSNSSLIFTFLINGDGQERFIQFDDFRSQIYQKKTEKERMRLLGEVVS